MGLKFNKKEKLCSKKEIEHLFSNGQSFISYPIRVVYEFKANDVSATPSNTMDSLVSILTCVQKKRIKSAVNRNRVKRLIRESYRLNRDNCLHTKIGMNIAFIYLKSDIETFSVIESAIKKALCEIEKRIIEKIKM